MPNRTKILPAQPDASPGTELIAAMLAELDALYGKREGPRPTATPTELSPPDGGFFIAWRGEHPVASGGFKRLEGTLAEIKRIYVIPRYRSRGIAGEMLEFVEAQARAAGYDRIRLQHGDDQPHALALYTSGGYHPIPDYNGNVYAAFWWEKRLS
jgi:GNAT superfamily N-acetyltransferase